MAIYNLLNLEGNANLFRKIFFFVSMKNSLATKKNIYLAKEDNRKVLE